MISMEAAKKEWQRKGWTTRDSPLGWWEWYIKYFLGRRLGKEDDIQVGRWKKLRCSSHGSGQGQLPPQR